MTAENDTDRVVMERSMIGKTFPEMGNKLHPENGEETTARANQSGEPVAWIEFAENGNVRFWTPDSERAQREIERGRVLQPLYTHSVPAQEPVAVPDGLEEAIRLAEVGEYLYETKLFSAGNGYDEPREMNIWWEWQQSAPNQYGQGTLLAEANKWHDERAEDGTVTEARKLRSALSAVPSPASPEKGTERLRAENGEMRAVTHAEHGMLMSALRRASFPAEPKGEKNWQDDPAADERWNAGCDFAMKQLCSVLDVDPQTVSWDAATETVDGDVRAVIGNILEAGFGEDWQDLQEPAPHPTAPKPAEVKRAGWVLMNDGGKRWRICGPAGRWVMKPEGAITADEARMICETAMGTTLSPAPAAEEFRRGAEADRELADQREANLRARLDRALVHADQIVKLAKGGALPLTSGEG